MPPYIIYAVYVFRSYFFRFIKSIVEEYKIFDASTLTEMEKQIDKEIDAELAKDQVDKINQQENKAALKADVAAKKEREKVLNKDVKEEIIEYMYKKNEEIPRFLFDNNCINFNLHIKW